MVPKGGFEPPDSCSYSNDLRGRPARRLAYKSIKDVSQFWVILRLLIYQEGLCSLPSAMDTEGNRTVELLRDDLYRRTVKLVSHRLAQTGN